jgi:hypothetical protein
LPCRTRVGEGMKWLAGAGNHAREKRQKII